MNEAYERILDELEKHRRDGYKVPALRVDQETYNEVLKSASFIYPERDDIDFDLDRFDGMVAGTKLIVDETISEPVPDDVELI